MVMESFIESLKPLRLSCHLVSQSSIATFFRGIIPIGVDFMSTTKEYKNYILEQLNILSDITYKPMMGEYLLYYKGILFGGIYDDRLVVKIVNNNRKYKMKLSPMIMLNQCIW